MAFKKGAFGIVDIIGISLVVVALLSAGGIYYTSSTYAKISDSLTNVELQVEGVTITYSNTSQEYTFLIPMEFTNPSDLDIEVISRYVEYQIYTYKAESYSMEISNYVGPGKGIDGNGTVEADSNKSFYSLARVKSDSPYGMTLQNSIVDGTTFVILSGFAMFKIVDFPDVTKKLSIYYAWPVRVYET